MRANPADFKQKGAKTDGRYGTRTVRTDCRGIKNAKTVQSVRINPLAIQIDPPEVISHDEDSYTDAPV